ncbi:hypothetical protein HDU78_005236 [Chytriomyces hyalinus]|nr:hypothetical protein HDU78_005236 [Chytriomyces hyalinus]
MTQIYTFDTDEELYAFVNAKVGRCVVNYDIERKNEERRGEGDGCEFAEDAPEPPLESDREGEEGGRKRLKASGTPPPDDKLPHVLERGKTVSAQRFQPIQQMQALYSQKGDPCRFRGFRVFKLNVGHLSYGPYFYPAPIDDPHMDPADEIVFNIDSIAPNSEWFLDLSDRHQIHSDSTLEKSILRSTAPVVKEILQREFACLHYDPAGEKFLSKPSIDGVSAVQTNKLEELRNRMITIRGDGILSSALPESQNEAFGDVVLSDEDEEIEDAYGGFNDFVVEFAVVLELVDPVGLFARLAGLVKHQQMGHVE